MHVMCVYIPKIHDDERRPTASTDIEYTMERKLQGAHTKKDTSTMERKLQRVQTYKKTPNT